MPNEARAERLNALREELSHCDDRECQWQHASGLSNGGDPGGIGPEHVMDYRRFSDRVIDAARRLMRTQSSEREWSREIVAMHDALAELDAAYPEDV